MRVRAAIAAALVLLTLSACSPQAAEPQQPAALTNEQAERLAVSRFRNFDAGVRAVTIAVPTTEVGAIELTGWFDYTNSVGYGAIAGGGTVWWSADTVAFRDVMGTGAELPLPADQWVAYPLDASSNPLAAALALVAELGADRPDNPQLLAQSDAAFIRADEVAGTAVEVFAGPPASASAESSALEARARYWLDETGLMLRFEAPKGAAVTVVDFAAASGIILPTTPPGVP